VNTIMKLTLSWSLLAVVLNATAPAPVESRIQGDGNFDASPMASMSKVIRNAREEKVP
jgi:hypothetical protein